MQTYKVSVVLLLMLICQTGFSLHDTTRVQRDSLTGKEIRFMPNVPGQKVNALGTYVATVDDSATFRLSYGLSVLNTVRGKVPNTGISPHSSFATVRQNAVLVIDGLTYVQSPSNSYNMNAFDYDKLSVLSRNAAVWYGAGGSGGAFIIESRTGEGNKKPTIEFNSSLTSGVTNIGRSSKYSQSYFSNAIAYMQDFGKIDTRISYNYLVMPSRDNKSHNVKINTGFNLNSKFSARVIIDRLDNRSFASSKSSGAIATDTIYNEMDSVYYYVYDSIVFSSNESSSNRTFTQGNLMLRYQQFRWLTFSSQGSLGEFSESIQNSRNGNSSFREDEQNRSLANLFITIKPDLGRSFSLSSIFGMQYLTSVSKTISDFGFHSTAYQDKYYVSGLNLGFRDYLFANYILRKDVESSVPDEGEKPTHLFSFAFVFSEALGLHHSILSKGVIRASNGRTFVNYRFAGGSGRRFEDVLEVGADLAFAHNRASLTVNYFNGKKKPITDYDASSGYRTYVLHVPESPSHGVEVILDAVPVRRERFEFQATLMWAKSERYLLADQNQPGINRWTASLFNTVTLKKLFLRCLIVARSDDFWQVGGFVNKNSQVKMRDVSLGYDLSSAVSKIGFREAHISLSMRNFWLLHSTSGNDVETYSMPEPTKSTSLNLYIRF